MQWWEPLKEQNCCKICDLPKAFLNIHYSIVISRFLYFSQVFFSKPGKVVNSTGIGNIKKGTKEAVFHLGGSKWFQYAASYVCHMCFPVRKKSGRSSLALAVWNSSLSLNLHSSSSSSRLTVCLRELRSALMTHRVAPAEGQTWQSRQIVAHTHWICLGWYLWEKKSSWGT